LITLLLLYLKSLKSPRLATFPISDIALTFFPRIKYAIANAADDNIQKHIALPVLYIKPGTPTNAKALATAAVLDNPTVNGPNIPVLPKYASDVVTFFLAHHPIRKDTIIIKNENDTIMVFVIVLIRVHLLLPALQFYQFL